MRAPTQARLMTSSEWNIVKDVFTEARLPSRYRILLTNGLGGQDRPFTIPTSAISVLTIPDLVKTALNGLIQEKLGSGVAGSLVSGALGLTGLASEVLGAASLGYIISIGPSGYSDMSRTTLRRAGYRGTWADLLVHETAHVWQSYNSPSSMTYLYNSVLSQCAHAVAGTDAYAYNRSSYGAWSSYNAEQQASIIEDWYAEGMAQSGTPWTFIRDKVRKGIVGLRSS